MGRDNTVIGIANALSTGRNPYFVQAMKAHMTVEINNLTQAGGMRRLIQIIQKSDTDHVFSYIKRETRA
jgi:hypothetical protein